MGRTWRDDLVDLLESARPYRDESDRLIRAWVDARQRQYDDAHKEAPDAGREE